MSTEINMIPYWAESLSLKSFISEDINKIYYKNKIQMYAIGKGSEFYSCNICKKLPLSRQIRFKRLVCIFEYVNTLPKDDECYGLCQDIDNLFRKAYKKIYKFINLRKNELLSEDVFRMIMADNPSAERLICELEAVLYFTLNIDCKKDDLIMFLQEREYAVSQEFPSVSNLNKEAKQEYNNLKRKLPDNFISDIFYTAENMSSLNTAINFLYDYEHTEALPLWEEAPLTDDDINQIILTYMSTSPTLNNGQIMPLEDFVLISSHLRLVMKAYNQTIDIYYKTNQETLYDELSLAKEQLKQVAEDLQTKEYSLNQTKKEMSKTINDVVTESEHLKSENRKLLDRVNKLEEGKRELDALRELAFSLEQDDITIIDDIDTSVLQQIKGTIVGGNPNWQNKIKEHLSHWNFISANLRKCDKSLLNKDMVVVNTNCLNHELYYFVVDNIGDKTKLHYVTDTNIDRALKSIANKA